MNVTLPVTERSHHEQTFIRSRNELIIYTLCTVSVQGTLQNLQLHEVISIVLDFINHEIDSRVWCITLYQKTQSLHRWWSFGVKLLFAVWYMCVCECVCSVQDDGFAAALRVDVLVGESVHRGVRRINAWEGNFSSAGHRRAAHTLQVTVRETQGGVTERAQGLQVKALVLHLFPQVSCRYMKSSESTSLSYQTCMMSYVY